MSTTDITSAVTLTARERQFLTGILLAEKPTDAEIVHVGEHGDTVAWRALLEKMSVVAGLIAKIDVSARIAGEDGAK